MTIPKIYKASESTTSIIGVGSCFKSELGSDESVIKWSLLLLLASVRLHSGERHKTTAEGTDGGSAPVEARLLNDGTLFHQPGDLFALDCFPLEHRLALYLDSGIVLRHILHMAGGVILDPWSSAVTARMVCRFGHQARPFAFRLSQSCPHAVKCLFGLLSWHFDVADRSPPPVIPELSGVLFEVGFKLIGG